ncbi:hypothetical protein WN51_04274 [Melipona quadrifasciata]|uniref:Uncharacterized protein n=1 Tax=Melipona quadrifasciata TaxID=166423 RepID=A0A0N0BCP1_9HYME|nr:hypothetical protein WN51_04274 [Melipona quadrifasciata]
MYLARDVYTLRAPISCCRQRFHVVSAFGVSTKDLDGRYAFWTIVKPCLWWSSGQFNVSYIVLSNKPQKQEENTIFP